MVNIAKIQPGEREQMSSQDETFLKSHIFKGIPGVVSLCVVVVFFVFLPLDLKPQSFMSPGLSNALNNTKDAVIGQTSSRKLSLIEQVLAMGVPIVFSTYLLQQWKPVWVKFALWLGASIFMNIVNKKAVGILPPCSLVLVQMVVAIIFLTFVYGPINIQREIVGKSANVGRWMIVSTMFAMMLVTSMVALDWGTVSMLLVGRNMMPLIMLFLERAFLPSSGIELNLDVVLSFIFIALGTVAYACTNLPELGPELLIILVNVVFSCAHRLMEKILLSDPSFKLSFGVACILNNTLGIPPILLMALWRGEHETWQRSFTSLVSNGDDLFMVLLSSSVGLILGFYSIVAQKAISATSWLALQTLTKIFIIFLTVVLLGEKYSVLGAIACSISLASGVWYSQAIQGKGLVVMLKWLCSGPQVSEDFEKTAVEKLVSEEVGVVPNPK